MIEFDPSQQRVLELDPRRHARVLGAPGSGKSTVLVEVLARVLERDGWSDGDVLALTPQRLAASRLRAAVDARVSRALGGSLVRTPVALAFAVVAQAAALSGQRAPRLLTGTAHDELVATVVEEVLADREGSGTASLTLAPEIVRSPAFRAELREFWRVVDDFDIDPVQLRERLHRLRGRAARESMSEAPSDDRLLRWDEALRVVIDAERRRQTVRPDEWSPSALLRSACRELRDGRVPAPRLVLLDDAQEIGEGELALVAACAAAGSAVWSFGDPDVATGGFRGERAAVATHLARELDRRGAGASSAQEVVLSQVHRHGPAIRSLVRELTMRVGTAGGGQQREAAGRGDADHDAGDGVTFANASSPSEQIGMIAHRMRALRLGLTGEAPLEWSAMAVVCRTRADATRVARGLAAHQVPTGIAAGGLVLREHRVARDLIRLLQHACDIAPLDAAAVHQALGGPLIGLDPVAVRRLRGALQLQERREARAQDRAPRLTDEVLLDACTAPGPEPIIDSRGGRALHLLGRLVAAGARVAAAGGTPRETLWALWEGAKLASAWQQEALAGRGSRADDAHRALDAVVGLFFALQRHEEQASDQSLRELLDELLESAVPEDSLAQRAQLDVVTVTTAQAALGREYPVVAVVGVQDGAWPNTRARGSLLGTVAFERWLRGGAPTDPSRRETIHDELRLFVQACSRAGRELLVVSIADDEHHPSPFVAFGRAHARDDLPSSRLTLRGLTSTLRRALVHDPADTAALEGLAALARAGVAGAPPDEWYGVRAPSTDAPLRDLADPDARVPVSPSQLETAETCPLNWAVARLGGAAANVSMDLGTLVHHAFETADHADAETLLRIVEREWHKLPFAAAWESDRMRAVAGQMVEGIARYLREAEESDRELLARESAFSIPVGRADLRGTVDRVECRITQEGIEVSVVDLKTGGQAPSGPETQRHAQLQAYQLATAEGAFDTIVDTVDDVDPRGSGPRDRGAVVPGGARLLFVHPRATKGQGFVERAQAPLDDAQRREFADRVSRIAEVMAGATFTARVEHHCSDAFQPGECRIHIVPAVSHA